MQKCHNYGVEALDSNIFTSYVVLTDYVDILSSAISVSGIFAGDNAHGQHFCLE